MGALMGTMIRLAIKTIGCFLRLVRITNAVQKMPPHFVILRAQVPVIGKLTKPMITTPA